MGGELPPVPAMAAFSGSGSSELPERWWLSFGDPLLDRLVEQALSGNLTIRAAWARLDQADAAARKAGADLLPGLAGEAGLSKSRSRQQGVEDLASRYLLGLGAAYELDLWGRLASRQDATLLEAEASSQDLRSAALSVSAEVASAWYQLVQHLAERDVLERQIKANQELLTLVGLRFRAGQALLADLLQQRQLVEGRRGDLHLVNARIGLLASRLAILRGLVPGEDRESVGGRPQLVQLPPLPATGLPVEVIQQRPDVLGSFRRLQAADQRAAAAVADRFPRIDLAARLETSAGSSRLLFDNWLASIAAGLAAPVVDGGFLRAEAERSQAVSREAFERYRLTVLEALAEVEDRLGEERRLLDSLQSVEQQAEFARQAENQLLARYRQGDVSYERVLSARISAQQLERSRLAAHLRLLENRIGLCRALAGGWSLQRPLAAES